MGGRSVTVERHAFGLLWGYLTPLSSLAFTPGRIGAACDAAEDSGGCVSGSVVGELPAGPPAAGRGRGMNTIRAPSSGRFRLLGGRTVTFVIGTSRFGAPEPRGLPKA